MSDQTAFATALQTEVDRLMTIRGEANTETIRAARAANDAEKGSIEWVIAKSDWAKSIETYLDIQGELGALTGVARHFGIEI